MAKKKKPRLSGTHFYRGQGLKGVIIRAPEETKIKLKVLAAKLQLPVNEAVKMILGHFLDNEDKYKLSDPSMNGKMVEITSFISPESHQELRIHGIYNNKCLKDLTGTVVSQYLQNHCKIKLSK